MSGFVLIPGSSREAALLPPKARPRAASLMDGQQLPALLNLENPSRERLGLSQPQQSYTILYGQFYNERISHLLNSVGGSRLTLTTRAVTETVLK